jgi:hypothetical protein
MDEEFELEPCPFCGGSPELRDDDNGETIYWIECTGCPLQLGSRERPFANPLYLRRLWNGDELSSSVP